MPRVRPSTGLFPGKSGKLLIVPPPQAPFPAALLLIPTKETGDHNDQVQAMDDAFGEHSKDADKTLTGVMDNVRAQLSRIGQAFYDPLIENDSGLVKMFQSLKAKIKEIKAITDPFATALAGQVLHLADIGKKFIDGFDVNKIKPVFETMTKVVNDAGIGLDNLVSGLGTMHSRLEPIRNAFKDAFSEVFPKKNTMSPLITMTRKFSDFMQKLVIGNDTVDKFKRVFKGMFSAVSLGIKIFKDFLHAISPVTNKLKELGSSVLDIAAKIGDFFTELNENYQVGKPFEIILAAVDKLKGAFSGLSFGDTNIMTAIKAYLSFINMLYKEGGGGVSGVINATFEVLIDAVGRLGDAFYNLTGIDPGSFFDNLQDRLYDAKERIIEFVNSFSLVDKLKEIFAKVKDALSNFWNSLAPLRSAVKTILTPLWEAIKQIGSAISEGLKSPGGFVNLAALMVMFEHFRRKIEFLRDDWNDLRGLLKKGLGISRLANKEGVLSVIDNARKALTQLQNELKSRTIINIAIAIGLLAAAFMLLASVDADKIALAGIAMGELLLGVAGLMKEMDSLNLSKDEGAGLSKMGTSFVKLSVAVLILAAALKQLDGVENVFESVTVLTLLLGELIGAAWAINKLNLTSFNKIATGMILMAVAVKILASAMKSFDGLNWEDVAIGLVSIGALIAELVIAAIAIDKFVGNGTFTKTAVGMIAMAVAIRILAGAVKTLGEMDPQALAAGILALIGILVSMGAVIVVIDKLIGDMDFLKISTGFLMLGASIKLIASAFKTLGTMNPDQIALAMMSLTFILAELSAVLLLANDSMLKCGAGLLLLAAGMAVLTAVIFALGSMDIMTLLKGLGGLAAALIILAVALKFIQGSILGAAALLIVAVALVPFAAALMMLTSLNLADLAGTILVLVVALAALTAVCYAMTGALIGAAALLVLSVALLAFGAACAILVALPLMDLAATLLVVAAALLGFAALSAILMPLLVPMAALAGIMILIAAALAVLGGAVMVFALAVEIFAVSGAMGANALLLFCSVISANLKTLTKAVPVLVGMAAALLGLDAALLVAAVSIAACAVALGLLSTAMIVFAAAAVVFSASLLLVVAALTGSLEAIKELLNEKKFKETASNAIEGIKKGFKEGIAKCVQVARELGQKVLEAIKSFGSKLKQAGADAIMGFVNGLKSKLADAKQAAATVGTSCLNKLKSVFKIKSPSRVTMAMGKLVDEGLAIGLTKNTNMVDRAAEDMGDSVVDSMADALSKVNNAMNSDAQPTITPIMDLTGIQNGVNSMNSMIDKDRVANISANYNANQMAQLDQLAYNQAQMSKLGSKIDELTKAMINQPTPEVNANVILQGDADGVFKLVRNSNNQYTKMHGKSAFA